MSFEYSSPLSLKVRKVSGKRIKGVVGEEVPLEGGVESPDSVLLELPVSASDRSKLIVAKRRKGDKSYTKDHDNKIS
jgi:hypothetical protein